MKENKRPRETERKRQKGIETHTIKVRENERQCER